MYPTPSIMHTPNNQRGPSPGIFDKQIIQKVSLVGEKGDWKGRYGSEYGRTEERQEDEMDEMHSESISCFGGSGYWLLCH